MEPLISHKYFLLLSVLLSLGSCELHQPVPPAGDVADAVAVQPAGFDRNPALLQYTRHARCRMGCRFISETEVSDILLHGAVNKAKSDPAGRPCATYALEGYTQQDHQHVRIIFAPCGQAIRVVTCIDLDHDFSCNCR